MSLSRRLIASLIEREVDENASEYDGLNKEKLKELANQCFLIQSINVDTSQIKKSIQDKIEHFQTIIKDDING